jgi:tetratricopeptide (TPR) repeat protein
LLGVRQAATGRDDEAERSFQKSLALLGRLTDENASKRFVQASAYLGLGRLLHAKRRSREAEDAYRQAIALLERFVVELPHSPRYWLTLFMCYTGLVRLLDQTDHPEEALSLYRRALELYANFITELPDEAVYQEGAIRSASELFALLLDGGQQPERNEAYRRALDLCEQLADRFPNQLGFRSLTAYWQASFGSVLTALGRIQEAEEAFRKARSQSRAILAKDHDHVSTLNNLAWLLATCPDVQFRNGREAVELAKRATGLVSQNGCVWNTLGIAHYRVGDWNAAIAALEKSMEVYRGRPEAETLESFSTFFLATAHWQRGDFQTARRWYDKAVQWMDKYQPKDIELRRFRAEADTLVRPEP